MPIDNRCDEEALHFFTLLVAKDICNHIQKDPDAFWEQHDTDDAQANAIKGE